MWMTTSMHRIHRDRLYSRVLSPWKTQCYIGLVWCFLFSILLTPPLVNAQYNNIDPPECTANDTLYCKPQTGDQFNWTDPIKFIWKSSAQPFVTAGSVDVKLWRIFDQKLCGQWQGISFSDGYMIRSADASCFNKVVDSTAPVNSSSWQFAFKIVNLNDNTSSLSNAGATFYIYKYDTPSKPEPPLVVSTVVTSTLVTQSAVPGASSASSASSTLENGPKSKTITPLLIAVISGAIVAVLVAICAIIAAKRARKHSHRHQSLSAISTSSNTPMISASFLGKGHKGDPDAPMEVSSIHSTTPLAKQSSISSFTQRLSGGIGVITQTTTTTSSLKSNSLQPPAVSFSDSTSTVPITASDAAMISDAFRKTLRKPDWKAEDDDDDYAEVGLSAEELRRRREAKELLKKELAEEGRGLHSVQRRQTKLLVHKVDEEEDDTATNTSTLGPGSSIISIVSGGLNQGNPDTV